MQLRSVKLAWAAVAAFALTSTARAGEAPCAPAAEAAALSDATPLQAATLEAPDEQQAAAGGRCRIGSAALQQSPWREAQLIDLRSASERQAQPLPSAMLLRRSDLAAGLLSGLGRPVLLLGSGTDDLSLQRQCLQLQAALPQAIAVLGGGAPAWRAAQPDAQASAQGPLRLAPAGLAGLLADPGAQLLVTEGALPADLEVSAQVHRLGRGASLRSLRRALQPLLAEAAREGGSVAVLFAEDSTATAALLAALSAPVWAYTEGPQVLLAWGQRQRDLRADRSPLASEACRWN